MEKTQKEYYLNEQMQAIQKELGERDEFKNEIQELEEQLKTKKMRKEAHDKVKKELKKLKMMTPMRAEATVVRNYIDWILALPWDEKTEDKLDIDEAEQILDEDHYGLEEGQGAHPRVPRGAGAGREAARARSSASSARPASARPRSRKSIARATGRKFVRLSLGGVRDEAEIRGHRRTYIGALPGKIIQSLKKAGTQQPGLPARRDRQDVDRLPRRPVGGAARGARPRAEPRRSTTTTSISTTTCRT